MSAKFDVAGGGAARAALRASLLFACVLFAVRPVRAASITPDIPVWSRTGAWQDSTHLFPALCGGLFHGPLPDSLRRESRALTVRFRRDRATEVRPDFGGYRIYRMTNAPDSS